MNDLIKLTGAELAVADRGITFTLYDLAKRFDKDHSKALKAFAKDISNLRPDQFDARQIVEREFKTESGNIYKTYEVDVKTAVWFSARYDPSLRMDIVNYAFEKLEQDHDQEVKQLSTKATKIQTKLNYHKNQKLNSYNGWESASKLIAKHNLSMTPSALLNALEEAGMVQSTVVERVVREPIGQYADKTEKGTLIFNEARVLEMIETGEI